MMWFDLLLGCALFTFANAKLGEKEKGVLTAHDFGFYHTKAFEELAKLYENKRPLSQYELMTDLSKIVASWCEADSECEEKTRTRFMNHYDEIKSSREVDGGEVPDGFNEDVLDSLSSMYSVINTVNTNEDIDEVLLTLSDIVEEIEEIKDANENEKNLAFGALSIAKESARLWHDVYSRKDHPLHGMHSKQYFKQISEEEISKETIEEEDNGRRLGPGLGDYYGYYGFFEMPTKEPHEFFSLPDFNITGTIEADITTFITEYAENIAEDITFIVPLSGRFIEGFAEALGPSIAASAAVAVDADDFE